MIIIIIIIVYYVDKENSLNNYLVNETADVTNGYEWVIKYIIKLIDYKKSLSDEQ